MLTPNEERDAALMIAAADKLERLADQATPGRWKIWGMGVWADEDGSSNIDTAKHVAETYHESGLRTFNAMYITAMDPEVAREVIRFLRETAEDMEGSVGSAKRLAELFAGRWG